MESNDELILASFAVILSIVALIITFASLTHPKSNIIDIVTMVILSIIIILYFFWECYKKIKQMLTKSSVKLAISIFLLEQALIKKRI